MDFEMPVMNGRDATISLCNKMKNGELKKSIPIVGLTAYNDEKDNCIEAGMKRFRNIYFHHNIILIVTKPATSAEIQSTLKELMTGELK
jgi:CheY-like chemotaxis protein